MKIRAHLLLMSLAIIVPAIASTALTLYLVLKAERQLAEQRVQDAVQAIALAIDQELGAAEAALKVWARSIHIENRNWEALHEMGLAARIRESNAVLLFDQDGQQMVNTLIPFGSRPLDRRANPERITEIIETQKSGVSDLFVGTTSGKHTVTVDVPVPADDGRRFVATQAFYSDHFQKIVADFNLPPDWIVGIFDRKGMTIARNHRQEEFVGTYAKITHEAAQQSASGAFVHRSREGIPIYDAFTHSERAGWTIAIGVPLESIEAPTRGAVASMAMGLFIVFVAAGMAAVFFGRRIARAVLCAREAAVELGEGRIPEPRVCGITELDELDKALRNAGALLIQQINARAEAEAARTELLISEQAARKEAEDQNAAKDQFLAMLGHELRNPLSAISGASMVLELAKPDSEQSAQARQVVSRQSKHLGRIVDDLLDLSRVMSGKIMLDRQPIDLADATMRCLKTLEAAGTLGRHRISVNVEPVIISADQTRLDQIISNLLVNAAKYTPEGGSIEIVVKPLGHELPCMAELSIRDTGIGIHPELMPNIFEVFVQGKASIERSMGGLGLGLALVRRLVNLHGGTVSAESGGEGQGSRFAVHLPCASAAAHIDAREEQVQHTASRRVLVIDDHEDSRSMLGLILRTAGHEVVEAADGLAGYEEAMKTRPDLAIVDIGLPGIDGYEVARRLRANAATKGIALIALTGYGQNEDRQRAQAAGFDIHLTKPISADELEAALRQLG
ncbi:MAG TPA: ATP-binding protein [Burkholderiales bacterium]|nr:ATP-binding protein [Burkholderiales bacterium]